MWRMIRRLLRRLAPQTWGQNSMIYVTRFNGSLVAINALLIETIEGIPDTIITLTTGKKIMVKESVEEVIQSIENMMRQIGLVQLAAKIHNLEE